MKFEEIERPDDTTSMKQVLAAFLTTADTGKALRIFLDRDNLPTWRTALARYANQHGYASHVKKVSNREIVVWASKRQEAK